ncbi:hypothetical protein MRX96_004640 [Rhipicephalus microplus]
MRSSASLTPSEQMPPSTASNASSVTPAAAFSADAVTQSPEDPRDAFIASLQLTLQVVGKLLPSRSPLSHLNPG